MNVSITLTFDITDEEIDFLKRKFPTLTTRYNKLFLEPDDSRILESLEKMGLVQMDIIYNCSLSLAGKEVFLSLPSSIRAQKIDDLLD